MQGCAAHARRFAGIGYTAPSAACTRHSPPSLRPTAGNFLAKKFEVIAVVAGQQHEIARVSAEIAAESCAARRAQLLCSLSSSWPPAPAPADESFSKPPKPTQISKESRFSSAAAFAGAMFSDADAYFIEAQAGADLAFLAALCIAVDEIFQDQKE